MRIELTDLEYHPTPGVIADEIWHMSDEDQLELLYMLANVDNNYKICMQLQSMMDVKHEDPDIYKDIDKFVALLNEYLNDYKQ